jgi:hypothetical protein
MAFIYLRMATCRAEASGPAQPGNGTVLIPHVTVFPSSPALNLNRLLPGWHVHVIRDVEQDGKI